jgi:hypothetical protein
MVHPSEALKQRSIPSLGFQGKFQDGTFEGRLEAQKEFSGGGAFFVTLQTVAHQSPLSMEFPRQEYSSEWVAISFSRGTSQLMDQLTSSALAVRFWH